MCDPTHTAITSVETLNHSSTILGKIKPRHSGNTENQTKRDPSLFQHPCWYMEALGTLCLGLTNLLQRTLIAHCRSNRENAARSDSASHPRAEA